MSRSSLLTYWTGKHIERNPDNLNEHTRTEYLEILWSILDEGIWMNKIQEEILGWSDKGPDSIISMEVPMVCFTELRLSQSLPHRARYGLLGIVVDRQFVLKRHGAPVFYIPSHADESIVGNLFQTLDWINKQPNPKKQVQINCFKTSLCQSHILKPCLVLAATTFKTLTKTSGG